MSSLILLLNAYDLNCNDGLISLIIITVVSNLEMLSCSSC